MRARVADTYREGTECGWASRGGVRASRFTERVSAIDIDHLTKRYGDTLAVDDLSFKVDPGRLVGFLGPNGAGKTTTLRALLGLIRPTEGAATVEGRTFG